jgi:hypothetical protein
MNTISSLIIIKYSLQLHYFNIYNYMLTWSRYKTLINLVTLPFFFIIFFLTLRFLSFSLKLSGNSSLSSPLFSSVCVCDRIVLHPPSHTAYGRMNPFISYILVTPLESSCQPFPLSSEGSLLFFSSNSLFLWDYGILFLSIS